MLAVFGESNLPERTIWWKPSANLSVCTDWWKFVYYWSGIHLFLRIIDKHNCNEISFYWCNYLVFMKIRCGIKMKETQIDIILENGFYWKHKITMKKNQENCLI